MMMKKYSLLAILVISAPLHSHSTVYNYKELGGKPNNAFHSAAMKNTELWNSIMNDTLQPGDTLLFPKDERLRGALFPKYRSLVAGFPVLSFG